MIEFIEKKIGQFSLITRSLHTHSCTLTSLFLAIFFVFISSLFVLGNFQSYNGDFGQYYIHAQNLLKDRPWGYSVEGYPAILPAYPYLLAFITYFFGASVFYYAIANSIMWAMTCLIWTSIYREKFDSNYINILYLAFIIFTPFVVSFQQEGLPNILFALFCAISIKTAINSRDNGKPTFLSAILIISPAFVRIECIAIFGAFIVFFLFQRKYILSILAAFGILLSVGADLFIGSYLDMQSNFGVFNDFNQSNTRRANQPFAMITSVLHLISSYLMGFGEMFIPPKLADSSRIIFEFSATRILSTSYLHVLFLIIFLMGAFKNAKLFDLDILVLISVLALISLFPLPEAPIRYLLPLLPIFGFYFIAALVKATNAVISNKNVASFFGLLLLLPIFYISLKIQMNEPQRRNFLYNKHTIEMADWVAENRNGRGIGFFKPRLMTVLMDLRDQNNAPDYNLRTIEMANNLITQGALIAVFNTTGFNQKDILSHLTGSPTATILWKNSAFTVFGAAPDQSEIFE